MVRCANCCTSCKYKGSRWVCKECKEFTPKPVEKVSRVRQIESNNICDYCSEKGNYLHCQFCGDSMSMFIGVKATITI